MTSTIDPADFTTKIDNPLFTLRPGTTFLLEERESNSTATVVVTHNTKIVDGVRCVEVHDTGRVNGVVTEDTLDWFAQDNLGNVWYFGEATAEFEPGNPDPVSTEGSFEAGVNGASAGIVMEADPQRGDIYRQEDAPGVAEDTAKVLGLNGVVNVSYGSFDHVLATKEFTPLDPGAIENKFYAPGVGFVLTTTPEGEREELARIVVDGQAGNDEVIGYAGGDVMHGRAGADLMRGLGGNDSMFGGTGNDTLSGGNGGDRLNGGSGDDRLIGGDGADRFAVGNLIDGIVETDTIIGYSKADVDVIDLPRGLRNIAGQSLEGGVWHLTLTGDGDILVLDGVIDANGNGRIVDDLLII